MLFAGLFFFWFESFVLQIKSHVAGNVDLSQA